MKEHEQSTVTLAARGNRHFGGSVMDDLSINPDQIRSSRNLERDRSSFNMRFSFSNIGEPHSHFIDYAASGTRYVAWLPQPWDTGYVDSGLVGKNPCKIGSIKGAGNGSPPIGEQDRASSSEWPSASRNSGAPSM